MTSLARQSQFCGVARSHYGHDGLSEREIPISCRHTASSVMDLISLCRVSGVGRNRLVVGASV